MRQIIALKLHEIHVNVAIAYKIPPEYLAISIEHNGIKIIDKSKNIPVVVNSFENYAIFLLKFF